MKTENTKVRKFQMNTKNTKGGKFHLEPLPLRAQSLDYVDYVDS